MLAPPHPPTSTYHHSHISCFPHPREPRVQYREAEFLVLKAIGEVNTIRKVVDKVDVVTGDECVKEVDDAYVVVGVDHGEPLSEL